jgi:hypothetical protein
MKTALVVLLLLAGTFGLAARPAYEDSDGLQLELRTDATQVHLNDYIHVTVFFRSPSKEITLWNEFSWGVNAGLDLKVRDATGKEVHTSLTIVPNDPLPPGNDSWLSIGGNVFAGFDSRIPASTLFPKPGRYTIRCIYIPRLPRNFNKGLTIWGKEDGSRHSNKVSIVVEP